MVITASGEVFTNNHVIVGATKITATDLGNGNTYNARVVGYDHGHDIAVLQLENASGLKTVSLADSSSLTSGENSVVTIGNAGGSRRDPGCGDRPGHRPQPVDHGRRRTRRLPRST
jgi:S1-C subfamily serine protease